MDGGNPCLKDPLAAVASEKHSFKRLLHTPAGRGLVYVCPLL